MPATPQKLTIDPKGMALTVDIADSYATSITAYTASGGASTHTLPLAISSATDFHLTDAGTYTVSAKFAGVEIAGGTIVVAAGVPAVFTVNPLTIGNLATLLADRANIATTPTTYTQTYSTANATVAAPTGVAITDNTTGTASTTAAAGVGVATIVIPAAPLAGLGTSAIDLLTNYTPGYAFKVLGLSFVTTIAGTGAAASQVFNLEIGTTNVTGGVLTLLLADTDTIGKVTNATAVTAANVGTASDTISLELAASGTVFTAGEGYFVLKIQNMDTANAVASLILEQLHLIADDLDNRQTVSRIIDDLQACGLAG